MRIPRANRLLNDAIEALDIKLKQARGNTQLAWNLLSAEELEFATLEITQCIEDRIYYLSNYHCIATERGQLTCLYPVWDHQYMVNDAINSERAKTGQSKVITVKPRQAGITEFANGVMCNNTFFTPHAYTMTVAQDPGTAAHVQRKVNIAWQYLPWWMRPERQYHTKGEFLEFNRQDMLQTINDPGLGSVFVTTHAQRSAGVAIGRTIRFLHLTEISRWPSGEVYTGDVEPSLNAPDTLAIAESTALGDGFFKNLWDEAADGESDWIPVFLPAYRAKKYSLPIATRQRPFKLTEVESAIRERVQVEENFKITDEFFNWRRFRVKSAIRRTGFPYAHYESYPITAKEAFQTSGQTAFPRHKLDYQEQAHVRRPEWIGEIGFTGMHGIPKLMLNHLPSLDLPPVLEKRENENRLYIWEKPRSDAAYYSSWDVGSAGGGDFNVGEIFRAGSGNNPDVQVAEWVGYEQPVALAKIGYALATYYNRCEIAVEYAKEGMITANYLQNELEYPNLYRPRNRDRVGKQVMGYLHWTTSRKTKALIVGTMAETLIENQIIIRSAYLLNEMYKFGKWGDSWQGIGSKDDSVMSSCINLFCLRETMPELRAPREAVDAANQTPSRGARISFGGILYGIYDEYFRLVGQTQSLEKAESFVEAHPGHAIKKMMVSKANTAYSVIHHGSGAENQMYRQGMDDQDILPAMIGIWRGAQAGNEENAREFNELAGGDEGWARD